MPEQKPIWSPDQDHIQKTQMFQFMKKMGKQDYNEMHRWSVDHFEDFWKEMLKFSGIIYEGLEDPVIHLKNKELITPGGHFFPNIKLNFAKNLLRFRDNQTALVSITESRETLRYSYKELFTAVGQVASRLQKMGVQPEDCIAGFLPNASEAVISMLAVASMGAAWSSCSPDFGVRGVLDRFGQIKPRILFAANAYIYNGKKFDCLEKIEKIVQSIPEIKKVVIIPFVIDHPSESPALKEKAVTWNDFLDPSANTLSFPHFLFNHPLYIMYSSGTTGIPKCIVHGAGGTLLQHAKELMLHSDLNRGDNIIYFTTCGWMMWNWLVSSLFVGATVTLFDGSPSYPNLKVLWKLADDEEITHFGTSAKFLGACRSRNIIPKNKFLLKKLRVVLSTGSPLLPEDFDWTYSNVKSNLQLSSISGGTDIISCFFLGNPVFPVHRGEIQCFGLGMDVASFDTNGQPVKAEKGELVCRKPFPSMPIFFWNDKYFTRYKNAYFDRMSGVWFHGDYIALTESQGTAGGIVVYGRSDATLNPAGVRIGTAEIYRLVETLPEVEDSIVIGQPWKGDARVVLFVKLSSGVFFSDELMVKIKKTIRSGATPRHVPAIIFPVEKIPYTISGKKVELAVLEVVQGKYPKNKEALADPTSLECYRNLPELQ
ncbi:MAG: acetoacetate--CoA ligase [Nitrospinota bacterium]|nr:acetoacetate--CoA ligase [Nitrospinota bacterium]MDP7581339.1 acetoacetate--CoA ligase [Nitrospinota bacterium]HJN03090.1 acetoacetate--CoA ligase [Nitrospinota bacterium]